MQSLKRISLFFLVLFGFIFLIFFSYKLADESLLPEVAELIKIKDSDRQAWEQTAAALALFSETDRALLNSIPCDRNSSSDDKKAFVSAWEKAIQSSPQNVEAHGQLLALQRFATSESSVSDGMDSVNKLRGALWFSEGHLCYLSLTGKTQESVAGHIRLADQLLTSASLGAGGSLTTIILLGVASSMLRSLSNEKKLASAKEDLKKLSENIRSLNASTIYLNSSAADARLQALGFFNQKPTFENFHEWLMLQACQQNKIANFVFSNIGNPNAWKESKPNWYHYFPPEGLKLTLYSFYFSRQKENQERIAAKVAAFKGLNL